MPLKLDERPTFHRGSHAVHVKRHKKLGTHCTVAKDVLPIANYLVDHEGIEKVELGKVANGTFTRRIEQKAGEKHVRFLFAGETSAQTIRVTPKAPEKMQQIIFAVTQRWMHPHALP